MAIIRGNRHIFPVPMTQPKQESNTPIEELNVDNSDLCASLECVFKSCSDDGN